MIRKNAAKHRTHGLIFGRATFRHAPDNILRVQKKNFPYAKNNG